jgi:hypothetical protein
MLQDIPPQPSHTRGESTDNLLEHETIARHTSLPSTVDSRKPHFLGPTMWMYEILSLLLAVSILGAVIIILTLFDNKPSLVVGGIILNAVVAFVATLFRICLMVPVTDCVCQLAWVHLMKGYKPLNDLSSIDETSRGPWGSIQLLLRLAHG